MFLASQLEQQKMHSNQNTALSNENYYSIAVLVKALSASFVAQVEMPETSRGDEQPKNFTK
ncbi:MAG: hypothetical protein AAFX80_00205 [Cyanobacteria bacterium J06639_18]